MSASHAHINTRTVNRFGHSNKKPLRHFHPDTHHFSISDLSLDTDADDYSNLLCRSKRNSRSGSSTTLHRFSNSINKHSTQQSCGSKAIAIRSINSKQLDFNNHNNSISLVTPPDDNSSTFGPFSNEFVNNSAIHSQSSIKHILDKAANVDDLGEVSYSCESIAMLTKAISERSLPPTPPRQFYSQSSNNSVDPAGSTSTINSDATLSFSSSSSCCDSSVSVASPSSVLGCFENSIQSNFKMTPRSPSENKLIPINLDPVPPMLLTAESDYSDIEDYDLDCAIYDDDDDDDQYQDSELNLQTNVLDQYSDEMTISPEFLVGYEQDIISQLNLEEDQHIVDSFRPRPLLADGNRPFIPCSPVYNTVEELFAARYPELKQGSRLYMWHLKRLERNRLKLRDLSQCIDRYDQARQKRLSESHSRIDTRFRARR